MLHPLAVYLLSVDDVRVWTLAVSIDAHDPQPCAPNSLPAHTKI